MVVKILILDLFVFQVKVDVDQKYRKNLKLLTSNRSLRAAINTANVDPNLSTIWMNRKESVFFQTVYYRLDSPNLSPFAGFGVNFLFYFSAKFLKFEPLSARSDETKMKQIVRTNRAAPTYTSPQIYSGFEIAIEKQYYCNISRLFMLYRMISRRTWNKRAIIAV